MLPVNSSLLWQDDAPSLKHTVNRSISIKRGRQVKGGAKDGHALCTITKAHIYWPL
jgi:hypothetical protein